VTGERIYSNQNYHAGLVIMVGAIAGLLGEFFIRETNCRYITLSVQK